MGRRAKWGTRPRAPPWMITEAGSAVAIDFSAADSPLSVGRRREKQTHGVPGIDQVDRTTAGEVGADPRVPQAHGGRANLPWGRGHSHQTNIAQSFLLRMVIMHRIVLGLLALLLLAAPALRADDKPAKAEGYAALKKDFDEANKKFNAEMEKLQKVFQEGTQEEKQAAL